MPPKPKPKKRKKTSGTSRPAPKVRVRMYRQGLGDCFLITFNPGANQVNMLIDFGTLGSSQPLVSMAEVMTNIESETNKHLHLLVATHEHKDHLSGFRTFKDRFANFTVDNVWLAWTEDKTDPLTQKLGDAQDIALALAVGAKALRARTDDEHAQALGETVNGLLSFAGDFGADFAPTVHEAMTFVRDTFGTPRYLKPNDPPREEAWLPGFRFYVLGPPHSETALRDMGDDHGDPRLYGLQGLAAAAIMRLGAPGDPHAIEREMPFDLRFRRRENDPVLEPIIGSYLAEESNWRRVDSEWLYNTTEFALQFDKFINNTSLALAIERIADGKVLLFPGDAQAGNWQSWQSLNWSVKKSDGSHESVTTRDLLNRTVFYKVGHHASHNGTIKAGGLANMTKQNELVAFIPVDRPKALNHTPPWRMPAQALYAEIIKCSNGRTVRSDVGWVSNPSDLTGVELDLGPIGNAQSWQIWKGNQQSAPVQIQAKWIDFTLD